MAIVEQPCQFRNRPASGNGHARNVPIPLGRDALHKHALHLFRPAVVPEHSWGERMLSLIKKNEGSALARESDRTDSLIRNVGSHASGTACPADSPPDLLDVLLNPTGMRINAGILAIADAELGGAGGRAR